MAEKNDINKGTTLEKEKPQRSNGEKVNEFVQDNVNMVKDGVNLVKDFETGNIKGVVENAVNLLKNKETKKRIGLFLLQQMLVPTIIIVLIVSLFMIIISSIGEVVTNIVNTMGDFFSGVGGWFLNLFDHDSGKFIITVNDKKFQEIKSTLASQGIDAEASNLTDECLKLFLIAQYKTQYPEDVVIKIQISDEEKEKIVSRGREANIEEEDGKFYLRSQGCIELYRPEFTGGTIRYTDKATLDEYENGTKSFDDVKDKYTIDSNGNLILPQKKEVKVIESEEEKLVELIDLNKENDGFDWESFNNKTPTSTNITRSLKPIPYQSTISSYTMPFELLTILTTFTQNSEFGVAVAQLVNNESKIKLNILDNSETVEEREIRQYTSHTEVDYKIGTKAHLPDGNLWIGYTNNIEDYIERSEGGVMLWKPENYKHDDKVHYVKRKNTITTEYTSTIQVGYVKTWLLEKDNVSCEPEESGIQLDGELQILTELASERYKLELNEEKQKNYISLENLHETEQVFKDFMQYIYKKDNEGAGLDDFRNKLLEKFDKDTMIKYLDEYVSYDLTRNFYKVELNKEYSEEEVGPVYIESKLKQEYYKNLNIAILDYSKITPNNKVVNNAYDIMPLQLKNTRENDKIKKANYVSHKKYNVSNVGDVKDNTQEFLKLLLKNKEYVYYTNDAGAKTSPAATLLSAPDMFFELIAGNSKTANLENAMRYIFYRMTNDDQYGVTDIQSAFIAINAKIIGSNYDVTDQSLWITSKNDLISAIQSLNLGGKAQQNLIDNVDTFLEMQSTYKVNAALAISVTIAESSAGTNGFLIEENTYNWTSIQGESSKGQYITDSNGTKWCKFSNFKEATLAFGKLISGDYCGSGNVTISQIGNKYCPNTDEYPTQADIWISNTQSAMTKILRAGGVDLSKYSGQIDASGVVQFALSQVGKGIYDVLPIGTKASDGIATYYGNEWCAMFVSYCFDSCGLIPGVLEHSFIGCTSPTQDWVTEGKMLPKEVYTPKAGDIIFYGNANDRDHTGIVTDCDGTYVYTVEGNSGSGGWWGATKVVTHKYSINSGKIYGYYTASEF